METQSARLNALPQRSAWPNYLFHVTHVSNAVRIVADGSLRARTGVADFHDIANQGALHAYEGSHDYARFYFRPKNPFHLKTEGIKCLSDPHRSAQQASIPVAFVFKLEEVITRPGVLFTAGNVQRGSNVELDGDDAFKTLDFDAIYHDDYVTPDTKDYIHDCRMAEVMVPRELPLAGSLQAIMFRTAYDRATFEYLLWKAGKQSAGLPLGVEKVHASIFMHFGLYIREITYVEDKITVKFHFPRTRPVNNEYRIFIQQFIDQRPVAHFNKPYQLLRPDLSITGFRPHEAATWAINLEDVLAFEGRLAHHKSEVFG